MSAAAAATAALVAGGLAADRPAQTGGLAAHAPGRWVPVLYLGFGHLCLATAFALVAVAPRAVAGFYYHPKMLAVVHLVTLGWITASILGALAMVGPMALRLDLPPRRADYLIFGLYAFGVVGMVAHFWIDEPAGMAWSGGCVAAALLGAAARYLPAVARAPLPGAVKLHVGLAFFNVLAAGTLGVLIGAHKVAPFLPGGTLANVAAHAHLAALGWATMMVAGIGYRLLPMLLPSAMPGGRRLYLSAALLEVGALGLFATLLARRWPGLFALLAAAGIAAFLSQVGWMARHRRRPARAHRRPDPAVGHAAAALLWLLVATALGLALALAPPAAWKLRAVLVYGVAGLVGFLAQMVVGVNARVLAWFAWLRGWAGSGWREPPPSAHDLPPRRVQGAVFVLWNLGAPLLAVGLAAERLPLLVAGASALAAATLLDAVAAAWILRPLLSFATKESPP